MVEEEVDRLYGIIGHRLRSSRQKKQISQDAVAKQLRVRRSSVTNFEHGRQRFPLHHVYAYAEFIGVPVEEVLPRLPELRVGEEAQLEEVIVGKERQLLPAHQAAFVREAMRKNGS